MEIIDAQIHVPVGLPLGDALGRRSTSEMLAETRGPFRAVGGDHDVYDVCPAADGSPLTDGERTLSSNRRLRSDQVMRGVVELAIAPAANQVATGVEDQHRMCPAPQDIYIVVGVYRDPRNVHQHPALRDLRRILNRLVGIVASSDRGHDAAGLDNVDLAA